MKDLANELKISASEVSESLHRSMISGLIAANKKRLMTSAVLDFLRYGLKYVYPAQMGSIVRGMPTAYSAPPLITLIRSDEMIVWPYSKGTVKGVAIAPLIPTIPEACEYDVEFYELMALTDALRMGKAREQETAYKELKNKL